MSKKKYFPSGTLSFRNYALHKSKPKINVNSESTRIYCMHFERSLYVNVCPNNTIEKSTKREIRKQINCI